MDKTPSTVVNALQPLPLELGNALLLPPTIGHCILLDRLDTGILQAKELPTGAALFTAIFILSHPSLESERLLAHSDKAFQSAVADFSRKIPTLDEAMIGVILAAHVNRAFEPYADTEFPKINDRDGWKEIPIAGKTPGNGLGWLANLVGCIASGRIPREILDMPVATAFALAVINRIQSGAEWRDLTYIERDEEAAATAPPPPAEPAPQSKPASKTALKTIKSRRAKALNG
jgi:hypothetical protein